MNTLVDEKGTTDGPVFYRFSAEFRRVGIYLLVAALIIAATMAIYRYLGFTPRSWSEICFFILFMPGSMCGLALVLLRQLLRVDDRGIWRRRLFRWDLWPWEAFAGEQIQEGNDRDSYIYRAKPWWNRYLLLEFLEEKDRKQLVDIIKGVWKPPPLPTIASELTIGWGFRRWARLSEEGIQIGRGKQDSGSFYPWWTVILVRMTRLDHSRRDLRELELELPGYARPVALCRYKGQELWRGATPEVLATFIERVVPADRLLIIAKTGPPRSLAETDWRMAELERRERDFKQAWWGFGLFFGTLSLGALIGILVGVIFQVWDCLKIGVMILLQVTLLGPIFPFAGWKLAQELRAKHAELAAWREAQSQ